MGNAILSISFARIFVIVSCFFRAVRMQVEAADQNLPEGHGRTRAGDLAMKIPRHPGMVKVVVHILALACSHAYIAYPAFFVNIIRECVPGSLNKFHPLFKVPVLVGLPVELQR